MPDILVMLPNNPGDVLMATPALRGLKEQGNTVHFLVDRECVDMVSGNPRIASLHVFERQELKQALQHNRAAGMRDLEKFAGKLTGRSYDMVVNLFQGASTAIMASLVKTQQFMGAQRNAAGKKTLSGALTALLYSIPYARAYAPAHVSDLFCLLAGVAPDGKPVELFIPEAVKKAVQSRLEACGISQGTYAAIHACSAHRKKEWDHGEIAALVALLEANNIPVVLTGSEHERERVAKIISMAGSRKSLNCAGEFNLIESAAVISHARCLVTGDTVAMHMAAATGTKIIAIFAPTSPLETGPYCSGATVFRAQCWCHGHYSGECSMNERCTAGITARDVLDEILGRPYTPRKGVTRYESRFDAHGFIDYQDQGKSGYTPVARSLVQEMDTLSVTQLEKETLEAFQKLLRQSIDCLSRLQAKGKKGSESADLVKKNAAAEKQMGRLPGIGAYLTAFLRFRNNSIESDHVLALTQSMIKNSEEMLNSVDKILDACCQLSTPSLDQGEIKSKYILLLGQGVSALPGSLEEMAAALDRDSAFVACSGKILDDNDLVVSAGDGSGHGLKRYNEHVIQYREIEDGCRDFTLVRKEALNASNDFSGRVLYCPDAEAVVC